MQSDKFPQISRFRFIKKKKKKLAGSAVCVCVCVWGGGGVGRSVYPFSKYIKVSLVSRFPKMIFKAVYLSKNQT